MVAMSLTHNRATDDVLDSQSRLIFSARQILGDVIAAAPVAPPRFHWSGEAREAYAARLQELTATVQRADVHLEAAARSIAVIAHA
jgi:hypothetical protein